jgi:mRNA interferase MazF
MKRGDLVTVALQGDFGKLRPALVIQTDQADQTHAVTVLPLTSDLADAPLVRLTVQPTPQNGLQKPSQVQINRAVTVARSKVGAVFGTLDAKTMLAASRLLAVFLGIA